MSPRTPRSAAVLGALALSSLTACGPEAGGEAQTNFQARAAIAQEAQAPADATGDTMPHPTVTLHTSEGDIRIELFPEDAPASVENFLAYVDEGFYEGIIFHRVISGFMIQAGGHTRDMAQREATREPITNESNNGRQNLRGTVAMARTGAPHSARSQFFINLVDNAPLDHKGGASGWGYAVFGRVIEGMDVVDAIAAKPTGRVGQYADVPVDPVTIESAERGKDIEPGA